MSGNADRLKQVVQPVVNDGLTQFVYFEEAPNFGCANGAFHISLATYRHTRSAEGIDTDLIAVASLRGNIAALIALKGAVDGALLLATPTPDGGRTN